MFQYMARVARIVDGDTLHLDLDLGFHIHVNVTVRLARINAPDVVNYGASGVNDRAMAYIEKYLPIGAACVVNISRAEKYGRWLAEVIFQPGEVDQNKIMQNPRVLNDELVREGLAVIYSGGKK